MSRRPVPALLCLGLVLVTAVPSAQINFTKTTYYLARGDSVAAGEGAMPVTGGYAYRLYDHGVFGPKQQTDFSNASIRGARSWDLRDHQVPQALCSVPALRPSVVTITAGANDFLLGDQNVPAIAFRVAEAVHLLLNNDNALLVPAPILDPVTGQPCPALTNATVLVSNYYSIPHPDPAVFALLDAALQGFAFVLNAAIAAVPVPPGSRVAVVDLYTPSVGRNGLLLIGRRLGYGGPLNFEIHPTNLGHSFIADQFAAAWRSLP
ncbi:MAG: hypothetical protein IT177_16425 [Acidobacteria bacterium]|nr:hypothetical protein [Acidobacteriota bacterium]